MLPLVVRVKNPSGQTQTYAFAESPVRIGRSPLNHITLDEEYVSRIEAVIRFDAKEVNYFNVGRTNTPLLDGRPLEPGAEVSVGERSAIILGKLELRFSREAVDEDKIIRRAQRPSREGGSAEMLPTTMFQAPGESPLPPRPVPPARKPRPDQAQSAPVQSHPPPQRSQPAPAPSQPAPVYSQPAPTSQPPAGSSSVHPGVVVARPVVVTRSPVSGTVVAGGAAAPNSWPAPSQPSQPEPAPAAEQPRRSFQAPAQPPADGDAVRFAHAEYRRAWQSLMQDLEARLMATPEAERPAVAEQLQRKYPQIIRENDFRQLLKRLGLRPRKPGDPELEQWLRSLGEGLFPPGVRLDTGMTIDRLGSLLKMFSQVFVEIQAAQSDARKQMSLPASGPSSLLASEDPNVILAYLLNPNVDGEERMAELEQCVTKLAVHEAALFGAVKDGAHALLESLAPDQVAREEMRSSGEDHGVLARMFGSKQDVEDAKLWRRFVAMHEELMDGKQYQRRFIGREFARIYLRAMEKLAPDL